MSTFTRELDTPAYKGKISVNLGLFINNEFVNPITPESVDVLDPATGKLITKAAAGSPADVDVAVKAARTAFKTTWGLNTPGSKRGELLRKLADLIVKNSDELSAIEAINNGKTFKAAKSDVNVVVDVLRYYSGWAGKTFGKTIETNPAKFAYTREEPIGVCGQIIPWNFPILMVAWKIAPALATGCTIVMKPSEMTPLSLLKLCELVKEAGFPPGVLNVVNGYGNTVGQAIAEHYGIDKIAFTGSTLVGRKITRASADSNLKAVSLELGGKSPNIILDDANVEEAVKWTTDGIFGNAGQSCIASSRVYIQEGIYDRFLEAFAAAAKNRKLGGQFDLETEQGPQVSQVQLDRVLGFIDAGKKAGATVRTGGARYGQQGFFVQPTIFTDIKPDMSIATDEIFGPVAIVVKFKTDAEAIELANDTHYGLAAAVFSTNLSRALAISNALEAGTVFVNNYGWLDVGLPFGGYKTSGWGRDLGEYALKNYTQTKAVHIKL